MSRFGLFLALTAVFCCISCSDDPIDDSAPYITNDENEFYTLFDTVEVVFNEALLEFDSSNYQTSAPISCALKANSLREVQCISDSLHYTQLPILPADESYTITFLRLYDLSNNLAEDLEYSFTTASTMDFDDLDGVVNDQPDDAIILNDSSVYQGITENFFYNGISIDSGITLSGYLERGKHSSLFDDRDFYSLKLRTDDSIVVEISDITENCAFELTSPKLDSINETYPKIEEKLSANGSYSYGFFVDGSWHSSAIGINDGVATRSNFLLRIELEEDAQVATPYTIKITRLKKSSNPSWIN